MSKDYGDNLEWFLHDVSCAEPEQLESSSYDVYGETESGADTSCEIDLRELCGAAESRIATLTTTNEALTVERDRLKEEIQGMYEDAAGADI